MIKDNLSPDNLEPQPKRGRPRKDESEKKTARNLSLSDKGWQGLEELQKELQLKSVSELCELIGLSGVQLTEKIKKEIFRKSSDHKPLLFADERVIDNQVILNPIPIYQRLKSLIGEPIAVFASIVAFTWRTALQLGLVEEEGEDLDNLVIKVIEEAIAIIFYIGYLYPDCYINNPSALMRYLIYKIFLGLKQSTKQTKYFSFLTKSNLEQTHKKVFNRLNFTNDNIQATVLSRYEYLRMKAFMGLTISQIITVANLDKSPAQDKLSRNTENVSEGEIRKIIKNTLVDIRSFSLDDKDVEEHNEDAFKDSENYVYSKKYYEVALDLTEKNIPFLEKMLLDTVHNNIHDFWMNEIDYYLVDELFKLSNKAKKNNLAVRINFRGFVSKISQEIRGNLKKGDSIIKRKQWSENQVIIRLKDKADLESELKKLIKQDVKREFNIELELNIAELLYEKLLTKDFDGYLVKIENQN